MAKAWNKFVKRIPIAADAQTIYKAWATKQGIESWFLRHADFISVANISRTATENIEAGDSYFWLWHGYGDDAFEKRKILQANGKDLVQFSFSEDCIVTVQIKEEAGENIVELTQENIPEDDNPTTNLYVGCGEGWTFYLANLK